MRFGLLYTAFVILPQILFADVLVTTWNMKWFPSGKAEVRNEQDVEETTIKRAGTVFRNAYDEQCRKSDAAIVVFSQEMRDAESCTNFIDATGLADSGLKLACVSNFKDNGGVPLWQQVAIMTSLPVIDSGFALWSRSNGVSIPRGFAHALLDGGDGGLIICFSLHLKSNLNWGGTEFEKQKNMYKREAAAGQILEVVKRMQEKYPDRQLRVLVGGDFNTDDDDMQYVSEATLRAFFGAHFRSCFRDLKKEQKITHPACGGYPDATFDYILYRGFERIVSRKIYSGAGVSDHNLVALRLR